ncbi:hypothetical protein VVD49_01215 [Uliginosibacterium sp. H3]|uniref:Uncharacterized protein n=1 Tax=Uliginosibacterium silvisoli TaxID=3114758 RepID=A0ABU6JXI5_9RHOO|nr:hypothetical protein [Uliginosibacterium sp. H3]
MPLAEYASPSLHDLPLNTLVERELLPQLRYFFDQLIAEGKSLRIDGVPVFNGKDPFLFGKIANGMSWLLTNTPQSDPDFARYLAGYREIATLTIDEHNTSWGIYYYVCALNRLREADLLTQAVSPETLERLRTKLDWRGFVRQPGFTLIDLPTNYYGVAFSIARLRHLLGWEDASASEVLLECMVTHYRTYSGEYGFSDETDGDGRFDRYSILLIGEICQRFIETDMPVPAQLKEWLRKAVDVILVRLNAHGDGFEFGRSIGPYGDTAFLEVLSAAARLDVLNAEERDMAYAFAVRATAKYVNFWFDRETHSVNLWDKGRRTDAYRGKHRILGENLSLLHQHIYTSNLWRGLGYRDAVPSPAFDAWLKKLPRFTLTWFARGEYDRALLTFRDGERIVSLPLVNGGATQHMHNPYFPIPFCNDVVQGAADAGFAQLLPRITLASEAVLIPTAFMRNVRVAEQGTALELTYMQDALDRLGEIAPVRDVRLSVATRYTLDSGVITRTDVFTPLAPLENVGLSLEFASFGEDARVDGSTVHFGSGAVKEFSVTGLAGCHVDSVAADSLYGAPMGQLKTRVVFSATALTLDAPFSISWTLKYR